MEYLRKVALVAMCQISMNIQIKIFILEVKNVIFKIWIQVIAVARRNDFGETAKSSDIG
jgi:hypothetical protein